MSLGLLCAVFELGDCKHIAEFLVENEFWGESRYHVSGPLLPVGWLCAHW